jgi:hypothetical protein
LQKTSALRRGAGECPRVSEQKIEMHGQNARAIFFAQILLLDFA